MEEKEFGLLMLEEFLNEMIDSIGGKGEIKLEETEED
jgi:hypothetical protein